MALNASESQRVATVAQVGEGAGKPEMLFVIIHGTASRKARWIRPDSKIRRRLERHFDRRGRTVVFEWSGANTDVARLTAGRELGRRILELYEEFRTPIYLVAHSHGGNIAMYAMRDSEVEEKVTGVVCLATAFIRCERRPVVEAVARGLELAPGVVGGAVLGVGALMGGNEGGIGWGAMGVVAVLFVARKVWGVRYRRVCEGVVGRVSGYVRERSEAIIVGLSLPKLAKVKMLCLESPNDEVGKCLRLSLFFSELPFYGWRFLNWVSKWAAESGSEAGKGLVILFYVGICAAISRNWIREPWLHWVSWLMIPRLIGLLILCIGAPLVLLWQLVLAVLPDLPGVLAHHFGGERLFDTWLTRFTVEPAPEGVVDCTAKEVNVVSGRPNFRAKNLRTFMAFTAHTRLYNNRGVLGEVIRWIYKVEEARGLRNPISTKNPEL